MEGVPVRAELYRAMEPGTHGAACSGEPGSHHADQSQPSPSEGPQANQAPSKPTRGGSTPPRGPETHSDEKPNQGEATRARGKTKPDKAEKKQDNQDKADERKPAKARPEPATQHKQGKANKPKASQNKARGWETAGVRASPRWFATARSRQKPAKPGERQLCRPDPSITQKPPTPASPCTFASPFPSKRAKPGGQLLCRQVPGSQLSRERSESSRHCPSAE